MVNALLVFCIPEDIPAIFALGIISEFAEAMFPTLFFCDVGRSSLHDGQDASSIQGAYPSMVMLIIWVPAIVSLIAVEFMFLYPLTAKQMDGIANEMNYR